MPNHLLVINTHDRIKEFRRLLTHIISYDNLFDKVLIIADSTLDYAESVKLLVYEMTIGSFKYQVKHLDCLGGASARSLVFKDGLYKNYKYLSFCDDDDIPFKSRFQRAELQLDNNPRAIGYSCSYIRHYGALTKKISSSGKIDYNTILKNNDIGGFSFVTLKSEYLTNELIIPENLKSNQDWYLWIKMLNVNRDKHFVKDADIGLVYNDKRDINRLTLSPKNFESTVLFDYILQEEFSINLPSVKRYVYYKYLRSKPIFYTLKAIVLNRQILLINRRVMVSLLKNYLFYGFTRLFLSKT